MKVGIPTEIKRNEYRVGMVPGGVKQLVAQGHEVYVERRAGVGSGISDEDYIEAGATLLEDAESVWRQAEMIVKVKEPLEAEHDLIQPRQIIYTFFHLAALPELLPVLLEKEVAAMAYETIELSDHSLPLLRPMSQIAGRLATQVGARCLEKAQGGRGVLLGGVPGVRRGQVTIIGAGIVGTQAARIAVGMGASVTVLDIDISRLDYLEDVFGSRIDAVYSNPEAIAEALSRSDLVIGAVLVPGARAPCLVTRDMLSLMPQGAVLVDVAVDQGGCIETCHPTTHDDPTYVVDGIVHYCVANMPGAVPRTSTYALTNATTPYMLQIASQGIATAVSNTPELRDGLNTYRGHLTHRAVAESLGETYTPIDQLIESIISP